MGTGVVKIFEEEGIAKGAAAVSYKGKMVDTPVYENARQILATMKEISDMEALSEEVGSPGASRKRAGAWLRDRACQGRHGA